MFSETVDQIIARAGRRELLLDVVSLANITIRELHSSHDFFMDMVEEEIIPSSTTAAELWKRPCDFQKFRTVRYGSDCWPSNLQPGEIQCGRSEYYYGTGDCFAFVGHGGTAIKVAYYTWSKHFAYYERGKRPAVYNRPKCMWTYLDGTATADEEAARNSVSSWMLENWQEVVITGTLSKLYTHLDDPRSSRLYALFEDLRKDLIRTHGDVSLGR